MNYLEFLLILFKWSKLINIIKKERKMSSNSDVKIEVILPSPIEVKKVPVKVLIKDYKWDEQISKSDGEFAIPSPRIKTNNKDSIQGVTMKLKAVMEQI